MDAVFMLYKSFDSDAPWQKGALRRGAHRKYRRFVVATVDIRLVQISKVMVADLPMGKPACVFSACGTERQSSPYFSIHDCGSVPKLSSQSLNRRSDQSRPFTSFR